MKRRPLPAALALLLTTPLFAQELPPHDRERARELDALVVTASPLLPAAENVIQPIEVLAGEELDDKRAGTIGETVANETGVQSSFFGAGVGRPIIRGQDGARVQVLEGGVSALDVSTVSVDHAVSIEPFLADQIEILKGPATLLYGSGAVGGAVNVVTRRIPEMVPEIPLAGRAELRGGTVADERTGMLRLDGGAGGFAWHVDAFDRDSSDYEIPGFAESSALRESEEHDQDDDHDDGDDHDDHDEVEAFGSLPNSAVSARGGAFGMSWITERGFIGASASRYETLYGIPGGHAHGDHADEEHDDDHNDHDGEHDEHDEHGHGAEDVRIDLKQNRYDIKGALYSPFAGTESASFRLGINNYEHIELEGDEVGTVFNNDALEGRVEFVHETWNSWRGAYGAQFSSRDFEAIGAEAFVPPSETRDLGVFLLEENDMGRWKFELGGRVDRVEIEPLQGPDRSFTAASFSAGALWRFSDTLHASLGFDRAERAPTAEELYSDGAHIATQTYEIGDAGLDTETANQVELALHLHMGPLTAKASAYTNFFDDFIYLSDLDTEADDFPVRQWTQADARFNGFEAEATLRVAENGSGAWDLRVFGDKVNGYLDAGGNLPRIAPARVGATLNWNLSGWRAHVGAIRHADQEDVATFESGTGGYTLVNAGIAFHWDTPSLGWELFLDGRNLTDQEARVHTSFLKDVAPLPGRNVTFGVRAFF